MAKTINDKFKIGDWVCFPFAIDEVEKYLKLTEINIDFFNNPKNDNILFKFKKVEEKEVIDFYENKIKLCELNLERTEMTLGAYKYKLQVILKGPQDFK